MLNNSTSSTSESATLKPNSSTTNKPTHPNILQDDHRLELGHDVCGKTPHHESTHAWTKIHGLNKLAIYSQVISTRRSHIGSIIFMAIFYNLSTLRYAMINQRLTCVEVTFFSFFLVLCKVNCQVLVMKALFCIFSKKSLVTFSFN